MDLRDLTYFGVVAEHGNLRRAAEALDLSQPALSKSLRRLEAAAGTKLVKRTPRGVELTASGAAVLLHARRLQLAHDDIAREVADLRQGRAGYLRLGVGTGLIDLPVSDTIAAIVADSPGASIKVTVASNADLVRALHAGDFDLVVSGITRAPSPDLEQQLLLSDHYVVFASAAHPLAARRSVSLAELAAERWALSGTEGLSRGRLRRTFEDQGLPLPTVALEAPSLAIRLRVIARSRLLGFNSTAVLQQAAKQYKLKEVRCAELRWTRLLGVRYRRGAYLSPLALRFIEELGKTVRRDQSPP